MEKRKSGGTEGEIKGFTVNDNLLFSRNDSFEAGVIVDTSATEGDTTTANKNKNKNKNKIKNNKNTYQSMRKSFNVTSGLNTIDSRLSSSVPSHGSATKYRDGRSMEKQKSSPFPVIMVDVDMHNTTSPSPLRHNKRILSPGNNNTGRSTDGDGDNDVSDQTGKTVVNATPAMDDEENSSFEFGTADDDDDIRDEEEEEEEEEEDVVISNKVKVGEQASGFAGLSVSQISRVYGLTIRLIEALSTSYLWIYRTILMALFIIILLPGFLRVALWYCFSPKVQKNVVYGLFARNRLDIIYPELSIPSPPEGRPIVIFVTGGAWIIGYKAWGSLLGKRLAEQGIITVLLDYRNFPQAKCDTMVDDVHRGISWVIANSHTIGTK